jgi:hypothetical protein
MPNCPQCMKPRLVFSSYRLLSSIAICPYCLGRKSAVPVLKPKRDRRRTYVAVDPIQPMAKIPEPARR